MSKPCCYNWFAIFDVTICTENVGIPTLGARISIEGERLEYLPEYFFQHLSIGLPLLMPLLRMQIAVWYWTSAGEPPLHLTELRVSGGSSSIDRQFFYIYPMLSSRKQNLRDVFRRICRSREPVYPPLWALTYNQLTCYYHWISLLTCVSHHQYAVCNVV